MKKIMVLTAIIAVCFLSSCSCNSENTYFNGAGEGVVEADSSMSKITEFDAVRIAINETDNLSSQYDTHDAIYYSDGTWHILFYNEPIVCDGGVTVIVDENTKEIIDIIEQE